MDTLKNPEVGDAFIRSIASNHLQRAAGYLDENLVAFVTQADGSTARVEGRDDYMATIGRLNIGSVHPSLTVTQIAEVAPDKIMMMVEIKAERKGRKLHNFAAFLMIMAKGLIHQIHMVEARPSESDAFWKS